MDLKDTTIVITGGRRVGQVVAAEVAAAGANIAMSYYQDPAEVAPALERVRTEFGGRAEAYPLNMTDEASVAAFLQQVHSDFPEIHGLVNMASIFEPDPAALTYEVFERTFAINAFGNMLLSRLFAEAAREQKQRSAPIVSFIDWAVDHPYGDHDVYIASKAALRHYLMALQTTFAGAIRVVNIHPGMILEPPGFPPDEKQSIIAHTPTHAIGDPEQAAKLTRVALVTDFLADNVYLDGGQHWRHRLK